ncbi:MAG: class II aldolase/adducin family protein [Bdellovibrionales bacterium]
MTEIQIRQAIMQVCQRLYQRNLLAASDGNVSYRISEQYVIFTPSGRQKAFIEPGDLAVVDMQGEIFSGLPSGERHMHLEIYRKCPKARAVIHAHPPHAVAWSLARPDWKELPADRLSEIILGVGRIPFVPYARPTTEDMGEALTSYLPDHRVLVLNRHGVVSWGEDLEEALNGVERVEHASQVLWLAETLGGSTPLPSHEVEILKDMRKDAGERLL